jgi:hypothetical protein
VGGSAKSEIVSVFNATALYMLAAPSMPEEVRTEIIERVENCFVLMLAQLMLNAV